MYEFIKNLIRKVIPKSILVNNEGVLRFFIFQFYRGSKYGCNICGKRFSGFIKLKTGEALCPSCGSLPRNRRLWKVLNEKNEIKGKTLDFSPSRCMYNSFRKVQGMEYVSTDYEGEFFADHEYDITGIFEPDGKFDLVICYHILEHIEEDQKAISELHRILKTGGKCYIQTPFKEGEIYEDKRVRTPEARKEHFGQEDHVRIYSVSGLKNRLEERGFKVQELTFNEEKNNFFGFKEKETVLVAEKVL